MRFAKRTTPSRTRPDKSKDLDKLKADQVHEIECIVKLKCDQEAAGIAEVGA